MIKLQAKHLKKKLNYLKDWLLLAILAFGVGVANAGGTDVPTVKERVENNTQ